MILASNDGVDTIINLTKSYARVVEGNASVWKV